MIDDKLMSLTIFAVSTTQNHHSSAHRSSTGTQRGGPSPSIAYSSLQSSTNSSQMKKLIICP